MKFIEAQLASGDIRYKREQIQGSNMLKYDKRTRQGLFVGPKFPFSVFLLKGTSDNGQRVKKQLPEIPCG
jgi:hypothetical protein